MWLSTSARAFSRTFALSAAKSRHHRIPYHSNGGDFGFQTPVPRFLNGALRIMRRVLNF
jgi:hypothetical protein